MKRELKFRAWNKITQKMYAMYGFTLNTSGEIIAQNDNEVMQFTGLKDKNGKDIYEGDIVRIKYTDFDDFSIEAVEYEDFGFNPFKIADGHIDGQYMFSLEKKYIEIIGNIYENSDLLN